ncbi:MAG: helix-turn-helix domain-containing protein [Methanospirillaceae archaeon]|nr:helix-turn-helix domain-containing protein [Methanospirillaceae archaeon]
MFSQNIFRMGITKALETELERRNMTIRDLAEKAGISLATLYKITSGQRDPRLSTLQAIVSVFEPNTEQLIAVIAAKFLIDEITHQTTTIGNTRYTIRGYTAHTIDDCITSAVRAEKDGAGGIICAPILASLIERIVDIPVVIIKPETKAFLEAIEVLSVQLSAWQSSGNVLYSR